MGILVKIFGVAGFSLRQFDCILSHPKGCYSKTNEPTAVSCNPEIQSCVDFPPPSLPQFNPPPLFSDLNTFTLTLIGAGALTVVDENTQLLEDVQNLEERANAMFERSDLQNAFSKLSEALSLLEPYQHDPKIDLVRGRLLRKQGNIYLALESAVPGNNTLGFALDILSEAESSCNDQILLASIHREKATIQELLENPNGAIASLDKAADLLTTAMSAHISDESLSERLVTERAEVLSKMGKLLTYKNMMSAAAEAYKRAGNTRLFLADIFRRRAEKENVPSGTERDLLRKRLEQSFYAADMFQLAGNGERVISLYQEMLTVANYLLLRSASVPVEYINAITMKGIIYHDMATLLLASGDRDGANMAYTLAVQSLSNGHEEFYRLKDIDTKEARDAQDRLRKELTEASRSYHELNGTEDSDLLDTDDAWARYGENTGSKGPERSPDERMGPRRHLLDALSRRARDRGPHSLFSIHGIGK